MRLLWLAVAIGTGFLAVPALAATQAGTVVNDTVTTDWEIGGVTQSTLNANASFVVAQLVRPTLSWQDASDISVPVGATGTLVFRLTNAGNGIDTFTLSTAATATPAPSFTPDTCKLYLDASLTQLYSPGVNDPSLASGAYADLYLDCHVPAQSSAGDHGWIDLKAVSNTLTGVDQAVCLDPTCTNPTQSLPQQVGKWAVTDSASGEADSIGKYLAISPSFDFSKAQSVQDTLGGGKVESGSTVTYTLTVKPTGSSIAYDATVTDPIPVNTTYKPGTITVDGMAKTDAQDSDNAAFDSVNNQIVVSLGDYSPTDPSHVITFQVTIN
jgi:uncharacterized repeat protein (TIGR01451 family)